MGRERLSMIYSSLRGYELQSLFGILGSSKLLLRNPLTGLVTVLTELGDAVASSLEDIQARFAAAGQVSFLFWLDASTDIGCRLRAVPGQALICEEFNLGLLNDSERSLVLSALLKLSLARARENSLALFTFDSSGTCEDIDWDESAVHGLANLHVYPEIIGLPKPIPAELQPAFDGYQVLKMDSCWFYYRGSPIITPY
jgi:hypothetical protein